MSDVMVSPELKMGVEPTTPKIDISLPSPEITPQGDKYAEQRQKLRSYMERKGNILPATHEFLKSKVI